MTNSTSAMGLLYTTWPDRDAAEAAARTLIEERLIACANILGESRSLYRWRDEVETAQEIVVLFKASLATVDLVLARLATLHPYDEPAILNLVVSGHGSSPSFLNWIDQETARGDM